MGFAATFKGDKAGCSCQRVSHVDDRSSVVDQQTSLWLVGNGGKDPCGSFHCLLNCFQHADLNPKAINPKLVEAKLRPPNPAASSQDLSPS